MQNTSTAIAGDDISRIFNRFVQLEEYDGPGPYGTGLGLYIAKQLVTAQAGRIWAESTSGRASIFCFTLPKYSEQIHADTAEPAKISQEN